MSQGFVLLGDKTTHDGEVISASYTTIVRGKPLALVVDGCRSECGFQVISSAPDCMVG